MIGKDSRLLEVIGRKEDRKLAARNRGQSITAWLGTFGMVGWSIVVPALVGVYSGRWLDELLESRTSWTLTFMILGMVAGCINAWYWISTESRREERPAEARPEGSPWS